MLIASPNWPSPTLRHSMTATLRLNIDVPWVAEFLPAHFAKL
jgi:hypothetical protein